MKEKFLLLLFFSLSFNLKAQHTVSGLITDKTDNSHLLDSVQVYIPEFERLCYSKEGGTYILRNVGVGTVHLQFIKPGFKSVLKTINTSDSATVINLEMEPFTGVYREVTSASDNSKFQDNLAYPVEVIPVSDIRRTGNIDYVSALSYHPGVDKTDLGSFNKLVIRGLSFNHLVMFQNGTLIRNNSWNEINEYGMIEEGTENIEIIKGPSSVLYGENAMGGVVIYKNEKMPPAGVVNGDVNLNFFNNTLGANVEAGLKGSLHNGMFYSVRAGGRSHTSYIQGEGDKARKNTEVADYAYHSGFASGMAKGMIGISKKWGQSRLTLSYNKSQNEIVTSMSDSMIALLDEITERERKMTEPFITHSSTLISSENIFCIKKSRLNINLSWQSNEEEHYYKTMALSTDIRFTTDASKRFGFVAGTQLYNQENKVQDSPDLSFSGLSGYALVRYDLSKINFLAGLRYDKKNVKESVLLLKETYDLANASAGATWHPTEDFTLKLNASSGFSVPVEQNYNFVLFNGLNPSIEYGLLSPEKNYEGDLGLSLKKHSFSIEISAYYNRIKDFIYANTMQTSYIPVSYYPNSFLQADADLKGGELTFNLHPEPVKWIALETSFGIVRGEFADTKEDLPLMPADKMTTSLRFQSERMNYMYHPYLSITARNYMKQEKIYGNETPSPAVMLLDLHLGGSFLWSHQTFELSISVNNILNKGYFNHLSPMKYMFPVGIREMGRNFSLQMHIPFGIRQSR